MESGMDLSALPEDCIATILSLTSPVDACRLSLLDKTFLSAAASDAVWRRFLHGVIVLWHRVAGLVPMRELYFKLCDYPQYSKKNEMSYTLERRSGKICYMLSPRFLAIGLSDDPAHWAWDSPPEYRFEVAELRKVWRFEIHGFIPTFMLLPRTRYAAYFVFKWPENAYGFDDLELFIGPSDGEKQVQIINFYPDEPSFPVWPAGGRFYERLRRSLDGCHEIEIGEFFNSGDGDVRVLEMIVREDSGDAKSGLVVYGIEVRPKEG